MRYTVEQIGHKDDIAKGNWSYGVKDKHKVILTVNELNPFRGNMEAFDVATICCEALNNQKKGTT